MLYHGSVGQIQSKQCNSLFTYTLLTFFVVFPQKVCFHYCKALNKCLGRLLIFFYEKGAPFIRVGRLFKKIDFSKHFVFLSN